MRAVAPNCRPLTGLGLAAMLWLALASLAIAQNLVFPPLTDRVVDQAHILSAETVAALDAKLAGFEQKSSIQLVVATVPSLQGADIESFANALFRHWGLGEKTKNNGALLLVAPKEKKIRIEVGYGLEGVLTDALSKLVIVNAMAPRFKAGDFSGGVARGVDDIIAILSSDKNDWTAKPQIREDRPDDPLLALLPFLIVALILFLAWRNRGGGGRGGRGGGMGPFVILPGPGWGAGSGRESGGFSGGGFSGGGGSSGGGGASGDW